MESKRTNPKKEGEKPILRLLCLHGFATNKNIMNFQLSQMKKLFPEIEFKTIDGTYEISNAYLDANLRPIVGDSPIYGWPKLGSFDLSESKERIVKILNEEGPFDGFVSFSQGCFLSHELLTDYTKKLLDLKYNLRLAVFIGAYTFPHRVDLLDFPTMHMVGKLDPGFYQGLVLSTKYVRPVILIHDEGHKVPRLSQAEVRKVRKFFDRFIQEKKEFLNMPKNPRL
eukprot:TRINITY_DN579_c0_g1_i3.p1 TRINITY_DN579_c0_g1~~TRINITY_DN579_c0_g1_i3.p1  ORF type:complete len:226 (+),score=17.08 TRINITY_DN579_c0_g1_i3:65-742(+)